MREMVSRYIGGNWCDPEIEEPYDEFDYIETEIEEPDNVGESFMRPISLKRMATPKDSLKLDTVNKFSFSYPLVLNIKGGKSSNDKIVNSYQELLETIASRQDKEWKIKKK